MKPQDSPQGTSLLQFSSDDPMLNMLPLMALRPSRILHAGSGVESIRALVQALSQEPAFKGWQPKISELQMNKPQPEIADVREVVATTLLANPGMIVNFSGGSKLTSVGAYQAAQLLGRPTLYVDSARERFVDGGTGRFQKWPEYKEAIKGLSMRVLMALRGRNYGEWRSEMPTDALRAFGLKAFELKTKHWDSLEHFGKGLRAHFYGTSDRLPPSAEEVVALLSKPLPPAMCQGDAAKQWLSAATSAGLIRAEGQNYKVLTSAVKSSAERALGLLTTTWIELAVLDCVLRNPRFREVHWGMAPTSASASDEWDIVCVDVQTTALRLISCKAVMDRSPQDHLERMASRMAKVGAAHGTFVLFKPSQGQESAIRGAARRMGIDVAIEADEIVKAFSPSVK